MLKTTIETLLDQRNSSSLNVVVVYGDKAGDVALVVAMFVVLLLLTTIGLLTAILRDEIENLHVTNVLELGDD